MGSGIGPVERLEPYFPIIRGVILLVIGVGLIGAGFLSGQIVAVPIGAAFVLLGLYFRDLENFDLKNLTFRSRPRPMATGDPRLAPGIRGLTDDRINAELPLYDAILRLQTARKWDGVRVPAKLDARIDTFWQVPELIGPESEEPVRELTADVLALVPEKRRRKPGSSPL